MCFYLKTSTVTLEECPQEQKIGLSEGLYAITRIKSDWNKSNDEIEFGFQN